MRIEKRTAVIGFIIVVAACVAAAFGLAKLSVAVHGGKTPSDASKFVGTWNEKTAGTEVSFDAQGNFNILGNKAATYTVDSGKKEVTFQYLKAYGGSKAVMTYEIKGNTMTLTNQSGNQKQTYTKKAAKNNS